MITLEEAKSRIGQAVIFKPFGTTRSESGIITKVNDAGVVFVRYGEDRHSKATYPHDLFWASS